MRVNPNDLDDIYLQGGVRVPAFLHGPPLAQATLHKDFLFVQFSISRPIISSQTQLSIFTLSFQFSPQATLSRPRAHRSEVLAHITDWSPTLLGLAGGLLRTFCISVCLYLSVFNTDWLPTLLGLAGGLLIFLLYVFCVFVYIYIYSYL